MYNRYIPQPDGSYRRSRMQGPEDRRPSPPPRPPREPENTCEPPAETPPCRPKPERPCTRRQENHCPPPSIPAGSFLKGLLPKDLDTGDLIVILLLLLMAGDCPEDRNTALLTLALYLFM